MSNNIVGFNGMRLDPLNGMTHLGNGYRIYNPVLMRFTCPDGLSPFGAGGISPYAYCAGDPVNRADASGHMSTGNLFGMFAGIIGGVVLGTLTAGLSLAVIDAAFTVALTGISMAIDHKHLSSMRGVEWAALIAGSLLTFGGGVASKFLGAFKSSINRPFGGLMMEAAGQSGQFRDAQFIGVYPSIEEPGHLLAFSFLDDTEAGSRYSIFAQPAMTNKGHFGLGSGHWRQGQYLRRVLGFKKIAHIIRDTLEDDPDIRFVRLAVPHASNILQHYSASFTSGVRQHLGAAFRERVTVTGPIESFEVSGNAVQALRGLQNSLRFNNNNQLITGDDVIFSPYVAKDIFAEISSRYGDIPGAFNIIGGLWR